MPTWRPTCPPPSRLLRILPPIRPVFFEAKGDAAAIRERARATAEGIEMISAAMRVPGGPDAAKLRVAEQWVAAWKERPPGLIGRGDVHRACPGNRGVGGRKTKHAKAHE